MAWAFGPDESLFFASRVTGQHHAEEAKALMEHAQGLKERKRGNRTAEERAQDLDKPDREWAKSLDEQLQRDRNGYRMQRWMEPPLVLFS